MQTLTGRFEVRPLAPPRRLGSIPLSRARPAIAATLSHFARYDAAVRWSGAAQVRALREAVCRRDDLPVPGVIELDTYLRFLSLTA